MGSWVEDELAHVDLGDARRKKRLVALVTSLSEHPAASVPEATGAGSATKATILWVARLGGFLARKRDGPPGVKVIWRGLRRLTDIAATWQIARTAENMGNA